MKRARVYFTSLSGRIVLLLTVGMSIAAFSSLLVAQYTQARLFQRLRLQSVVASAVDIGNRLDADPPTMIRMLGSDQILGARFAPAGIRIVKPDPALSEMLQEQFGRGAEGQMIRNDACFPTRIFNSRVRAADMAGQPAADCWLVHFRDHARIEMTIAIGLPRFVLPPRSTLDPIYLMLIVGASALLGIVTAQLATAPLRDLTSAARAFSISADPEPLPEKGPREVRTAIATFNLMQKRVTQGLRERTQILAAISHDLQTPLTRLRLRLEQVADPALREKLIGDVASTNKLVREGLDLARSSESREEWQIVDVDSLLASLAEDAAEFGADVTYAHGCGESVRTKPDALIRCLTNLVDNALKYGGSAELRCARIGAFLEISIRDRGPGLPPDMLERMFEPFVRAETSRSRATGGTGIGLTIARAQARLFEGKVALRNNVTAGLTAVVRIAARG